MATYRGSMNTNNNSSKTTQDKTNRKITKETTKTKKMDQQRLFTFKHELLKLSYIYKKR
jgi:hypothetical protein